MEKLFAALEATMNKSSIAQFRNFTQKYSNVTKWILCSDYCIDDKNKANNVVSFVIYPYILDFNDWSNVIESLQKSDLKHCRKVSPYFCDFAKSGYFFCFSFIMEKNCIMDKWKDKVATDKAIQDYINLIELWQQTTPENADRYKKMNRKFKDLQNQARKKSFNYKLLGRIMGVTFLASYLKYLLLREVSDIEIFSWMSDRDDITNWNNEIYLEIYQITAHCLISKYLSSEKSDKITEVVINKINQNMFHDSLNRVADFFCGGIADYNYSTGSVTGAKQYKLMEDAIADNDYLIILKITDKGVVRCIHKKRHCGDIKSKPSLSPQAVEEKINMNDV